MIPKIIHYCWLSDNPFPPKIQRCIDSWKKALPDYELRLWNFERLGDNCPDWVREAFDNRQYAFAADWVRAYALYTEGGIYLDSDVEVLRNFDEFLHLPYFLCRESGGWSVEAACMGSQKETLLFKEVLRHYDGRHFVRPDGTFDRLTMPEIFTEIIDRNFLLVDIPDISQFDQASEKICVLPSEYFSPLHTVTLQLNVTPRTVAIHHFAGSWMPRSWRMKKSLQRLLGARATRTIQKLKAAVTGAW